MFGGVYTLDFQKCGYYVDVLPKEAFQTPVSINKCDSAADVKTSHGNWVRAWWKLLRGKRDSFSGVGPAPESEARP